MLIKILVPFVWKFVRSCHVTTQSSLAASCPRARLHIYASVFPGLPAIHGHLFDLISLCCVTHILKSSLLDLPVAPILHLHEPCSGPLHLLFPLWGDGRAGRIGEDIISTGMHRASIQPLPRMSPYWGPCFSVRLLIPASFTSTSIILHKLLITWVFFLIAFLPSSKYKLH